MPLRAGCRPAASSVSDGVGTVAILPIKSFAEAKRRLGPGVPAGLRVRLAEAMAGDVIDVVAATPGIDRLVVVTDDARARALGAASGALVVDDHVRAGQSEAARLGLAAVAEGGWRRAVLLAGDCPAMDPRELGRVVGRPVDGVAEVLVVPDRHGTGTNALVLTPPGAISPGFGPGSLARHLDRARAAGARCSVERLPSLALAVDTPADLSALRDLLAAQPGVAPRTRELLSGSASSPALAARTPEA